MRAVADTNVLVSAVLGPTGTAGRVIVAWVRGEFELIVSPHLLSELERVLGYPKIRRMLSAADALSYVSWLAAFGTMRDDPAEPAPVSASDPDDDYLLALCAAERSYLVSGDNALVKLSTRAPVVSVRRFLQMLAEQRNE